MPYEVKQQRKFQRSRKPLASSSNTRDSIVRKQKSQSKIQNFSDSNQRLMNRSIEAIGPHLQIQLYRRKKQYSKEVNFYDKYNQKIHKKEFPNISIIQQKDSIQSNQENSLDSLNNFISQGNKNQNSLDQKSHQESSISNFAQDWTLLYKQCQLILHQNSSDQLQSYYLEIISQLQDARLSKFQKTQQNSLQTLRINEKLMRLHQGVKDLKQMKKKKQKNQFGSVVDNLPQSGSFNQEKSSTFQDKSLQLKLTKQILQKSQTSLQKKQFNKRSSLSSYKLENRINDNSILEENTSYKLLQILSEESNKITQDQNKFNQNSKENKFNQQESPPAQIQSLEKQPEDFMKFMNNKCLQENQPNLSLNNISNIITIIRPKGNPNRSIQNQTEIKKQQDDEVVAMLENQLRGNIIQQIPQSKECEILLKESRDNLCLNELEGEMQNNIHPIEINEEVANQSKSFFFALEARQKWIKSLEKEQKWKSAQLHLLSKMKKILHNPYIQFPEE